MSMDSPDTSTAPANGPTPEVADAVPAPTPDAGSPAPAQRPPQRRRRHPTAAPAAQHAPVTRMQKHVLIALGIVAFVVGPLVLAKVFLLDRKVEQQATRAMLEFETYHERMTRLIRDQRFARELGDLEGARRKAAAAEREYATAAALAERYLAQIPADSSEAANIRAARQRLEREYQALIRWWRDELPNYKLALAEFRRRNAEVYDNRPEPPSGSRPTPAPASPERTNRPGP